MPMRVITQCVGISPVLLGGTTRTQVLGFEVSVALLMVVAATQEALRHWWRLTRQPSRIDTANKRAVYSVTD